MLCDFIYQDQEIVFPGVLSSLLFFFFIVTDRGQTCLTEVQGTNECEAKA